MKDKSKTPGYKPRPFVTRLLTLVKLNNFHKNVIFSRKTYNNRRLGFLLLSTLCLKWSHKLPSIKTNYISKHCSRPCLVIRQMFRSTSLTKHGRLFTHSLTSFICLTPLYLVVKGLRMWDFSWDLFLSDILTIWDRIFVLIANLTFRFVVTRSLRSFASAIFSAYKWIQDPFSRVSMYWNKI